MANILILEDDFILANDFATALDACGNATTVVGTATEGLELCLHTRVDLAIVDIFIRKGNDYIPDGGLSLITKIRHTSGLQTSQRIPIIAISGAALVKSQHDPLVNALEMGATKTMVKPIDLFELLETVEGLLPETAVAHDKT